MNDNICAISTALGVGAIAIIRATGPDVISIVNKLFKGHNLEEAPTHTIHYGHIVENDEIIDEVLISVMRAPKTFTCEDVIEINCHGGISSTNRILETLLTHGCRLAEPGEFTKRAFLNGRIDLVEAEAVNDLINAESEEERKYAINRVQGNLSQMIKEFRGKLLELRAQFEVNFDYPEESDAPEVTHAYVKENLEHLHQQLHDLLEVSREGEVIKNGIDVAIVGRPNVGKSSILNHLLDKKKAIVTEIAGTTRDIVEGTITINGLKLNLIDTAGIRKTKDVVEKIGVDKSLEVLKTADLVIYVLNNNEKLMPEDLTMINSIKKVKKIVFINKNDLENKLDLESLTQENVVIGNTISPNGLNTLKDKILQLFNLDLIKSKNYNFLSNTRTIALVKEALIAIENALESTQNAVPLEMIAVDIDEAYNKLGEIIGETYKDALLDELFSKFCLGK